MTEELRIAAAVVTYNRKELLAECVGALLEQTYPVDILIIDNASTDGTRQELEELICQGKVQYINTGANLGGAGGFHVAVKEALIRKYDYICLMDDDTIPEKDALSALVHALKDTK